MAAPTLDTTAPTSSTGTPVGPRRGRWVAPLVAALLGVALAAGLTWLLLAGVTLDIAPASVGL